MKQWDYHTARDLELPMRRRWMSVFREPGFLERSMHRMTWHFLRLFLRLHEHLKISGCEHLPKRPPFVLIANHSSHLDALVLGSLLPSRQLGDAFSLAAGDTFFANPVGRVCSVLLLNALPFWRKKCVAEALDNLRQRMTGEGACLILFPEGTRTRDGLMHPFKSGVGVLVSGTEVPVVPCYISGAFEAWPPGQKYPRRGRIDVRIAPSLCFNHVPNNRAGWEQVAQELEAAVKNLSEPQAEMRDEGAHTEI